MGIKDPTIENSIHYFAKTSIRRRTFKRAQFSKFVSTSILYWLYVYDSNDCGMISNAKPSSTDDDDVPHHCLEHS